MFRYGELRRVKGRGIFKIDQKSLGNIVGTWRIGTRISYRIFKCGNCRRVLRRAWHYWLDKGIFKTPVHLCNRCQRDLNITYPKAAFSVRGAGVSLEKKIKNILSRLIAKWDIKTGPRFKKFTCDYCLRPIFKANHIFLKLNSKISEAHICKQCWERINIKSTI